MSLENFMVLPSNHAAFSAVQSFPNFSGDVLVIYGESGIGKTHLLSLYHQKTGADLLSAETGQVSLELTTEKHAICDDLDKLDNAEQEKLFHLFNHIKSFGGSLLVASSKPVAKLDILPDLKSRLLTAPQMEIEKPTDAHLEVLLVKMASDRQMFLEPKVLQFILKNSDRSVHILQGVLSALDKLSLEQKRKITIPLVKEVL